MSKETNLQTVQDRILAHQDAQMLLDIYEEIYNGVHVPDDQQSPLQNNLRLAGLVKEKGGYLQICNEIYRHVFNPDWIEKKRIFIRTKRKAQTLLETKSKWPPLSVPSKIKQNGSLRVQRV